MTRVNKMASLKHLGSLHGQGGLSIGKGASSLGLVRYEIDGYRERTRRFANGQVEGDVSLLEKAFRAGGAVIALAEGPLVDIVLSDPEGGPTAEIVISGRSPW